MQTNKLVKKKRKERLRTCLFWLVGLQIELEIWSVTTKTKNDSK